MLRQKLKSDRLLGLKLLDRLACGDPVGPLRGPVIAIVGVSQGNGRDGGEQGEGEG